MNAGRSVLVIGGGTVGNALAILLRRAGVRVDLVELDPDWSALGSGITLQGNALQVLHELGIWDEVSAKLEASGPPGPFPALGGPHVPHSGAMYRPDLQEILCRAVRASGADVRLGVTASALEDVGDGVVATFTDGTTGRYDLVVGADGIRSAVRRMIGIEAEPTATGLAIWRVHARRPAAAVHSGLAHGRPVYIAGYSPVSPTHLYAYVVEDARPRAEVEALDAAAEMRRVAAPVEGEVWEGIRADMTDPARIDYRYFEYLLVDDPWFRGRTIVIGDAAHACPPTLAQGAAMGLEDASVLARLVSSAAQVDAGVLAEFMRLRFDRVRLVVETSVQICRALLDPDSGINTFALMGQTMQTLAAGDPARPQGATP
ncbi:FAD-dependent monooxygenase [Pseudonocardia lacus]|uniref:FAD-dependent monooxygenase n=1 Tax=Pseudonocardia lacus TaxID=2835865 RepID=UPI001BDBBEB9|nr:FAD-dependent monooxygenase [Pseudonocardia lacus]